MFLNECLREAIGRDQLTMDNIYQAEKRYSETRLIALRDEWKDPYLDIDKVLERFRRCPNRFSRLGLTDALNNIALLLGDATFRGTSWLEPMCAVIWMPGNSIRSWTENYFQLTELLYSVGFLGVVKGRAAVYSYEDPNLLVTMGPAVEDAQFEIHPAFQQALDVYQTAG